MLRDLIHWQRMNYELMYSKPKAISAYVALHVDFHGSNGPPRYTFDRAACDVEVRYVHCHGLDFGS